jgi:murein DD-endopeptidase MepM/ murein hydrolase activator NlpD
VAVRLQAPIGAGVVAVLLLVLAGVAGGAPSTSDRKAEVDRRLERADARAREARSREAVLTSQVETYTRRIRAVERRLAPLDRRARALEAERDRLEARLQELTQRLLEERARLALARARLAERREYLGRRVREIYRRGSTMDPVQVLIETRSLGEMVAVSELLDRVVLRDRDLVRLIRRHAAEVKRTRDRIAEIRRQVRSDEVQAATTARRARAAAAVVARHRNALNRVRNGRQSLLSRVSEDRQEFEREVDGLRRESAALAAKIVAAQGGSAAAGTVAVPSPSAAGFSWPVQGALTSRFGPRWGRMHEGIDIGAAAGTPIAAAAAGTVIVAGTQGGYGQLVVVDHGGGLSTAYAHQSRIAVSVGQVVGRGSILGYVGCTGHCFGDHLHFEVRVNGAAVDPLGYL